MPGKCSEIRRRDQKVISGSSKKDSPFVFKKGQGCFVWDADNKKYLDLAAGIAVMNLGYGNKAVNDAIEKQLRMGTHAAFNDFYSETPINFLEQLLRITPKWYNNAFLSNSGTEAVECMYKAARWHTNRKYVIAFDHCFHGRTMGSLSMTNSKPIQRERFGPFLPIRHISYPYFYRSGFRTGELCVENTIHQLETELRELRDNVAAVFVEPIQGEGGYVVPPEGFHKELRKVCTENDVLMCADEVQAGVFRTGEFLAMSTFGVTADITALAKAIGFGLPMGVTITNKKIFDWPSGSHSNTFGGNLLACAAAEAGLKYMVKNKVGENARKIGEYTMKVLKEWEDKYNIVGNVRGKGLMIGIEFVKDKKSKDYNPEARNKVIEEVYKNGLVMLPAGMSVLRIAPPLVITKEEMDHGLTIIENAIRKFDR